MSSFLDRLVAYLRMYHHPEPPPTEEQLEAWQRQRGWCLDEDLLFLYQQHDGALLFPRAEQHYRFLPLEQMVRARVLLFGEDSDAHGDSSWYALCEAVPGEHYAAIDVSRRLDGHYPILECSRRRPPGSPQCRRLAWSLADFIDRALHGRRHPYWCSRGWWLQRRPPRS